MTGLVARWDCTRAAIQRLGAIPFSFARLFAVDSRKLDILTVMRSGAPGALD